MTSLRSAILWVLLLVTVLAWVPACVHPDPQSAYEHANQTVSQGDMTTGWREAEKGYAQFHNVSPEWALKFTILKARVLYHKGMYDEVIKLLSSDAASSAGNLAVEKCRWEGLAETSLHRFAEAAQKFEEAGRLCAAANYPACANVNTAKGTLEMERGHYHEAQACFERVLFSARASGDKLWEANALLDLSWSADEQTHFDQALDWASRASQIAEEEHYPGILEKALGNEGWAYFRLGDLEKAESIFVEAEQRALKLGMVASQAGWLTDIGYVYMDAHRFELAAQFFLKSLDLVQRINSRADILTSLTALAFVSEQTGKLDDARRFANEALSMAQVDGNKRDEIYPRLVMGRVAAREHDVVTAESFFHEVAASADAPVFLKWQAEHSLARLYEDETKPDAAAREFRNALSTFESARMDLRKTESRLPFLTNATAIYDDYVHFLAARGETDAALQVADFSRARTLSENLGSLSQPTSFTPYTLDAPQIARSIRAAVLFYWLGEKQSYLWAITPQRTYLFPLPTAREIEASVERYSQALDGPQDVLEVANEDGRALYRTLVAPARALLPKDTRVIIIPDGKLNDLNFETLIVPGPKSHYWIEDVTIVNASSLRLLSKWHDSKQNHGHDLLLFGNARTASPEYPELPNAAVEMASVAKHFARGQVKIFQRDEASPATYLASGPEKFSYIHFVAHGTASRLSPLDSAIVLSNNSASDDSFKLYARDIIRHTLHAQLVTISACYGVGTRAYSGEGLVGLSWAFLRAGAHNVIAALWESSDVSTVQLMDRVYGELNLGEGPDVALRIAKLSLLHSGGPFHKPYYWASFQLYAGS